MRVLAIDQSQGGPMGLAVVDNVGDTQPTVVCTHVEYYKLDDGKYIPPKNHRKRCRRFAKVVFAYYQDYHPDVVVLEIVRVFHGGKPDPYPMMRLSEVQGIIYVIIPEWVPVYLENVSSWQSAVLHGKRGADYKQLSIERVQTVYGLTLSEHACDAINMADALPVLLQRTDAGKGVILKV